MNYTLMSKQDLENRLELLMSRYEDFKNQNLKLNMARGKPGDEQLALSDGILTVLSDDEPMCGVDKFDARNYGLPTGMTELKEIFASLLGVDAKNVIIGGSSSLNMMFDYISQCMTHGVCGNDPWFGKKVKFLCPVPGYDRHFGILEHFGIEMILVEMNENGPDMDKIEELVKDESVKGMFCVPKYSNPTGITFSDETVQRIAKLSPAAKDFRIIWDNAYCIHDVTDTPDTLLEIFSECRKYGTEDMIIEVASFAKITYAGACVSALVASENNLKQIEKRMFFQIINHDKVNQLRHVRYFKDADGVLSHMQKHKELLAPKFSIVLNSLKDNLSDKGIASWTNPNGGYFVSLDVPEGCAKRVVSLCKEAGLVLTGAGATYPYGNDPFDRNIRIAPTFPSTDELAEAMKVLCVCVEIASIEKLLK
ncbi:MAG: aminotransferase class I/II-fold pyridoxal phosphate-dependent enzyme [Clostridia bacterium]|nr:aminotransferase class I/II-fold pyridoxal phosphate-dependent enzyme [Clostridia bacterium]